MKFYEFNNFAYYALIGAQTEEKAIEYYEETVSNIDDEDGRPEEILQEDARRKLLDCFNNEDEIKEANKVFNGEIEREEPYLILIDGLI